MENIILSEGQVVKEIPYDLTYKWNLINKTNKQAKHNQRHGNKEQTDREEGKGNYGGKSGKGHQGRARQSQRGVGLRMGSGGGRDGESGGRKMETTI